MVSTKPTGILQQYIQSFDIAAQLLIKAAVSRGDKLISLDELYYLLGADTSAHRTSVLWGIRRSKDAGIICSTQVRGIYQVCA